MNSYPPHTKLIQVRFTSHKSTCVVQFLDHSCIERADIVFEHPRSASRWKLPGTYIVFDCNQSPVNGRL